MKADPTLKLIYHPIGVTNEISPFDEALTTIVRYTPLLRLASPYIGLGFFQRIVSSAENWRLLSDIEAWLQSVNRRQRAKCWEFITNHQNQIRHVADLHAKVAIGNGQLFLGSANFTDKGMLGRAELSVVVTDEEPVQEAIAWFDALWEVANPPLLDEGDALIAALEEAQWTAPRTRFRLTSTAPKVAAVLAETERPTGFDLAGSMARAGLAETEQLASVQEAYRRVSDEWAANNRSFTFGELVDAIHRLHPGPVRNIWDSIIRETANHWLGGLDPEGFDRYAYSEGRFRIYDPLHDKNFILTLTHVLAFIVSTIPPYPERSPLPLEHKWESQGVPESHILPIVDLLIGTGLLIEHDEAGDIESYSIDPYFEWPRRWDKLAQAKNLFEKLSNVASSLSPQLTGQKEAETTGHNTVTRYGSANVHRVVTPIVPGTTDKSAMLDRLASRMVRYCLRYGNLHLTKETIKILRTEATIPNQEIKGLLLQLANLKIFNVDHQGDAGRVLTLRTDAKVKHHEFPHTAAALAEASSGDRL